MINYLSIDFESWAYPNLPQFIHLTSEKRKILDNGFIKESAEKILKILDKYHVKITFFVIGELYEWYPKVFEEIAKEGHEIAYHTHRHESLTGQKVLIDSLARSRRFIEKFHPHGFRAPEIIMQKEYLEILSKYGFTYDTSIYGSYHFKRKFGQLLEVPVSTYPLIGKPQMTFPRSLSGNLLFTEPPVGSGYLIATFGKAIGKIYSLINKQGNPFVAFLHNWQIVSPRDAVFPDTKYVLTHPLYIPYMKNCQNVFEYLLSNFEIGKMQNILKS